MFAAPSLLWATSLHLFDLPNFSDAVSLYVVEEFFSASLQITFWFIELNVDDT